MATKIQNKDPTGSRARGPKKCEKCGALIFNKNDNDRLGFPLCSMCGGFGRDDGNLSRRKEASEHRQGQMQRFVDTVQTLSYMRHSDDSMDENGGYRSEFIDKIMNILKELRMWDITETGDLYLTSGGRVVLDKGWGECFGDGDRRILDLEHLHSGMEYNDFLHLLQEVKKEWDGDSEETGSSVDRILGLVKDLSDEDIALLREKIDTPC